jgi:hypothetical protein
MLRRKVVAPLAALAMAGLPAVALAGDFHNGSTLMCSDCHVMHYSQQHGYNPDGSGIWVQPNAGPHAFLLRNDVNALCLSCHDGNAWAPDVLESHANGYVRQAGALNEVGSVAPYPETTGHTLGSTDVAPGGTWSDPVDGVTCVSCHRPHGSTTSYRNLRGPGNVNLTYSRGDVEVTNDLTKWIFEDQSTGVSANHYGQGAITFNEPTGSTSVSLYGDFCKGCHTNFHGAVGGAEIGGVLVGSNYEEFIRHPATSEINIGAVGGGHSSLTNFTGKTNQLHVMSPTGQRAGSYDGTDTGLSPSCFSCHKGHGNQHRRG